MTKFLYTNFAESTLAAELATSATSATIQSSDATKFPSPGTGEAAKCVIYDGTNTPEVVHLTSNVGAGVMTITRSQESTSARTWAPGSKFRLTLTAGAIDDFLDQQGFAGFASLSIGHFRADVERLWRQVKVLKAATAGSEAAASFAAAMANGAAERARGEADDAAASATAAAASAATLSDTTQTALIAQVYG